MEIVGKYPAIVVENEFTTDNIPYKGCIKVVCPELLGWDAQPISNLPFLQLIEYMEVSEWVRPMYSHPSDSYTPALGEGVYIECMGGRGITDLIWTGCFPGADFENFLAEDQDKNKRHGVSPQIIEKTDRIIGTRNGSYIKIEDKEDGKIVIEVWGKDANDTERLGSQIIMDGTTDAEKVIIVSQNKDGSKQNHILLDSSSGAEQIVIEDVEGNSIVMDAAGMLVVDKNANEVTTDSAGVLVKDKNANEVTMDSAGTLVKDKNSNEIAMDSAGINIKDKNSNEIQLTASGVKVKSGDAAAWMPCIIGACLFTGAPHGGAPAGIIKLTGG